MVAAKLLEQLRARRSKTRGSRRRRKKVPPQRFPNTQELRLRKLLERMVDAVAADVAKTILPLVKRAAPERQDAAGQARMDGPEEDAKKAAAAIRRRLASGATSPASVSSSVDAIAKASDAFNRRELDRVFEVTLEVGLPGLEPGVVGVLRSFSRENARRVKNLGEEAVDRVSGAVLEGFRRGTSNRDIAAEIQDQLGISRRRARLIARDQIGSLNAELTRVRHASMGVESYRWRDSNDERVRKSHEGFDGQTYTWAEGSPEGHPGEPVQCRCSAEPVLDDLLAGL